MISYSRTYTLKQKKVFNKVNILQEAMISFYQMVLIWISFNPAADQSLLEKNQILLFKLKRSLYVK